MEWKDNENRKRFPQKLWYPDNYLSRYNVFKFKTGIRTVIQWYAPIKIIGIKIIVPIRMGK